MKSQPLGRSRAMAPKAGLPPGLVTAASQAASKGRAVQSMQWGKGRVQKSWTKEAQGSWAKRKQGDRKVQGVVNDSFIVDNAERFTGTVLAYWKLKGYGFISMDTKGLVPDDKLFVYWENIRSGDRFPMLLKGTQVEFALQLETQKNGEKCVCATDVSLPGGVEVELQEEEDAKKKYVGGQHLRYTGRLKFFNPRRGFGYIEIDEGFQYDIDGVPKEVRVETAEVNAGGKHPPEMKDMEVEFGIWQTQKGAFKAYNMTGLGGIPLSID